MISVDLGFALQTHNQLLNFTPLIKYFDVIIIFLGAYTYIYLNFQIPKTIVTACQSIQFHGVTWDNIQFYIRYGCISPPYPSYVFNITHHDRGPGGGVPRRWPNRRSWPCRCSRDSIRSIYMLYIWDILGLSG
jgi:hypothetical protein